MATTLTVGLADQRRGGRVDGACEAGKACAGDQQRVGYDAFI